MNNTYASASLYVGDLASDVTEGMLFETFNFVGPVASIRVCRDAVTRRSLGYAYVNYHNVLDAERALDTLNSSLIKGRPCRIMWSQRDPSLRKSGVGNIFIKNLDRGIDHKALYDTFSAFGNILSCKVVSDENSGSKGYGFVHFETKEAAEKATAKVNGMMLNNSKVFVGPFVPRKERLKTQDGETKFTNVYVKNLDENVTVDELLQMFGSFGEITKGTVMSDENGKSKGFGFFNFENPEAAKAAVDALNGKEINGKAIYVGRFQKKAERQSELKAKFEAMKMERLNKYQGVNLYVKNLEDTVDDQKLRGEFAPFGTITSSSIMRDDKGGSKGFGFVCFSTPEEATRAVTEMNGKMIGSKPLYVALAQRKDVRKAQLEAQHAQRSKVRQPAMGPMYPPATPVFYSPSPQGPQPFVYPQQMMPRSGWRGPAPQQYPLPPHYVVNVPPQQRQQQQHPHQHQRMPRGPPAQQLQQQQPQQLQQVKSNVPPANTNNARRGGPRNGPRANDQVPQQPADGNAQNAVQVDSFNGPLTEQSLASLSLDQQRNVLGERIYPLVFKEQPELAGKITGMLLDSVFIGELVLLAENPEALHGKIQEALDVLRQHSA